MEGYDPNFIVIDDQNLYFSSNEINKHIHQPEDYQDSEGSFDHEYEKLTPTDN